MMSNFIRLVILFLVIFSFFSAVYIFREYKNRNCVDKIITTDNRLFYGSTSYSNNGLVSIYGKDGSIIKISSTLVKEISKECK